MKFTYHGPSHAATIDGPPDADGKRPTLFEGWLAAGGEIDLPDGHPTAAAWRARGWLRPLAARAETKPKKAAETPPSSNS